MSVFWGGAAAPPIKGVLAMTMAVFWGGSGGAAAPRGPPGPAPPRSTAYELMHHR